MSADAAERPRKPVSYGVPLRVIQGRYAGLTGRGMFSGDTVHIDLGPDEGHVDLPADWVERVTLAEFRNPWDA